MISKINRIYSVEGYHPTIPSQESSGRFFIYLPDIKKVRKLTINECFKIMGFNSRYKKVSSTGQLYRQIGNSVGVNVIDEISKQITKQGLLDETQKKTSSNIQKVVNKQTQFAFKDDTNGQSLFGDVLINQNTISTNSSNANLEINAMKMDL